MGIDQARLVHYEINRAVRVRLSAKENLRADTVNLVLMILSLSSIPKSGGPPLRRILCFVFAQ